MVRAMTANDRHWFVRGVVGLDNRTATRIDESYNRNLWIDHPFEGAAYLPR